MPRIRTIKPEAFESETLGALPLSAERNFIALWTAMDDEGRAAYKPSAWWGRFWAVRAEEYSKAQLVEDLRLLEEARLVCVYEVEGKQYLHVPTWREHQRVNRPTASVVPPCPSCSVSRGGCVPDAA